MSRAEKTTKSRAITGVNTSEPTAATKDRKTGRTITLEFAAEIIAGVFTIHRLLPSLSICTAQDVGGFCYLMATDSNRLHAFGNLYDQALEDAITWASWIAIAEDELANRTANKKIDLVYAFLRYLFYEAPSLPNPRFDVSCRKMKGEDHNRLMKMVWEMLENSPTVQAEISRQRESGDLHRWRINRRKSAMKNYGLIKGRFKQKFPQYRDELRRALIEPVKTSEKNSGATNADFVAPDAASGATTAGNLAPPKQATKRRKKMGL